MLSRNVYREALRELKKASLPPHKINPALSSNFRALAEKSRQSNAILEDLGSGVAFMRAQREYQSLLARYNPLIDLTAEERIEATAHRVGLNMPKTPEL
ncbi:hypothetical protein D9758_001109 [Tetrapyrgos nigripes]|uniref:Uncharacterized protein n=1 Tax=Tetrapyrgos nigripes TaxID=182062 RepID=A0A8H5LUR0_9AGAR|nr:hypothetical protein D9758_001109 [Tetrapyrgos nigripes]